MDLQLPPGICVTYNSGYIWLSSNSAVIEYSATTGGYIRSINNIDNPSQLIFTGGDLFVISHKSNGYCS